MAILATHPASIDECNVNLSSPTTNPSIIDTVLKEFEQSNPLGDIPSTDKNDPQNDYKDCAASDQLNVEDPLQSETELDISHKVSNESNESDDEAMDTNEERESLSTNISTNFKIDRNRDVVKKIFGF